MKRTQGYSLLEILITLTILSFGLLGVAGIALNSLKGNQSAYSRTLATMLANDIIARMRANRAVAERVPSPYTLAMDTPPPPSDSVPDSDLTQWRGALASRLHEGKGAVTFNPGSGKVTVIVQWVLRSMDRTQAAQETQRITIETRL